LIRIQESPGVTPQDFLQKHFYCDGHADTFARVAFAGADFVSGKGAEYFHIDYAKMKKAGLNLQLMAVYIPPEIARHQGTVTALWIAQFVHRVCEALGPECRLVLSRGDLERAAQGGHHMMLTLEGVAPMLGDLDLLELFFRFGFRSIGITHNANNWAAGGCSPSGNHRYGLTEDGKALVKKALGMGVAIDCAHLSRKGFYDLLSLLDGKPLINTHACCARFVDIERNLTNDQLVKLADTGGVVGITFVPDFLSSSKETSKVSSADVFAHLQHAVELIGIDHVAIGGDFDGVRYLPNDLSNLSEVPNLIAHMQAAGWSDQDVAKVVGGNWRRVLGQLLPE
jgi:membrane dipeptidase